MWVALGLQKLLTFFAAKIQMKVFENTLAITVNKFAINELFKLTMLWTTGPLYPIEAALTICVDPEQNFRTQC